MLQLRQIAWLTIQGMHQYIAQVTSIRVPIPLISWQIKEDIQAQIPSVYKAYF